ncbi:O-fucosyltransferase family protein [Hymenobacter lapidiphilus]|uniref:Alpha-1,2-fucosyltransferase n=1 Tax=Hymenobacter lapidiphilus TaxID=2608003 RepID=A0A7Y7PR95_9BACT|nr:hypothetical protein [Hymenobacter lapidiphilus]NVO32575.1 hypothetical protein [Hymenobacter lapidiphilus]
MVILVKSFGQLGNRLFLFAHLIANAAEHGYALANPCFGRYARYFVAPTSADFEGLPVRIPVLRRAWQERLLGGLLRLVQPPRVFQALAAAIRPLPASAQPLDLLYLDDNTGTFDMHEARFVAAARQRVVLLHGWCFRDRPSFLKHAALIRRLFEPVPVHSQAVAARIATCRRTAEVLVGVHIRRGDYATFADGQYYYDNPQYAHLMRQLLSQWSSSTRVEFLLCSDETLDLSAFEGLRVHCASGHFVEDLYALAACDYVLGPPSSFSMWSSFYGQTPLCHIHTPNQAINLADFAVFLDQ